MLRLSATSVLLRLFYGALLIQATGISIALAQDSTTPEAGMELLGGSGKAEAVPQKGHVPLDVNGYPVAPPELELEQVHIYVRHGASRAFICTSVT